jgi:hypothetical protein
LPPKRSKRCKDAGVGNDLYAIPRVSQWLLLRIAIFRLEGVRGSFAFISKEMWRSKVSHPSLLSKVSDHRGSNSQAVDFERVEVCPIFMAKTENPEKIICLTQTSR